VMLLEGRPEATRPQWRISCQKGWRGMWSPHDLDVGGGESADVEGRQVGEGLERWKGGKVQVVCGERP
jgi:hypothetical protein